MPTRIRSFSKVNLGLAIGPVRADGFHGLTTVYQTLALHDLITVSARRAAHTRITLSTDHPRVPTDGRNTAWKIVAGALDRLRLTAEVEIHLDKRLPVQGGMGAGSANAASALLGLERELGVALSPADRLRLAAEVGSDVPLFLLGGAVLGLGRGEQVVPLPDLAVGGTVRPMPCVVAVPNVGVSTPMAFREWDRAHAGLTPGSEDRRLNELSLAYAAVFSDGLGIEHAEPDASGIASGDPPRGDTPKKTQASAEQMAQGTVRNDLAGNTLLALVRTGIENDFQEVVFGFHPSLRATKRLLMGDDSGAPAIYAALSGSGSALFGIYRSESDARAAQRRVQQSGTEALLTETLPRRDLWQRLFADVI